MRGRPSWEHLRILEVVDHGRWGRVFRTVDGRTGDARALILGARHDTEIQLLEFEQRARVRHPSLPRVIDVGLSPSAVDGLRAGSPFLLTEWIAGTRCDRAARPLPGRAEHIAAWIGDVAGALAALHAVGLVHGGVAPRRVVLADDGRGALIGFGLGPGLDAALVASDPGAGGLEQAPEAEIGALEPRSDIYGLGATAVRVITGRSPDPDGELPPLSELPSSLAELVRRMMARDPDHRPRSALAVLDELDRHAGGGGGPRRTASRVAAPWVPVGWPGAAAMVDAIADSLASGAVAAVIGPPAAGAHELIDRAVVRHARAWPCTQPADVRAVRISGVLDEVAAMLDVAPAVLDVGALVPAQPIAGASELTRSVADAAQRAELDAVPAVPAGLDANITVPHSTQPVTQIDGEPTAPHATQPVTQIDGEPTAPHTTQPATQIDGEPTAPHATQPVTLIDGEPTAPHRRPWSIGAADAADTAEPPGAARSPALAPDLIALALASVADPVSRLSAAAVAWIERVARAARRADAPVVIDLVGDPRADAMLGALLRAAGATPVIAIVDRAPPARPFDAVAAGDALAALLDREDLRGDPEADQGVDPSRVPEIDPGADPDHALGSAPSRDRDTAPGADPNRDPETAPGGDPIRDRATASSADPVSSQHRTRRAALVRHVLPELDDDGVAAVVAALHGTRPPRAWVHALRIAADGLPCTVIDLLRSIAGEPQPLAVDWTARTARGLADLRIRQLRAASAGARRVVAAVAAWGGQARIDRALAALRSDGRGAATLADVAELERAGLARRRGDHVVIDRATSDAIEGVLGGAAIARIATAALEDELAGRAAGQPSRSTGGSLAPVVERAALDDRRAAVACEVAEHLLARGRADRALVVAQRALAVAPARAASVAAYAAAVTGDSARADFHAAAAATAGGDPVKTQLTRAQLAMRSGATEVTEAVLVELRAASPDDAEVTATYARWLVDQARYQQAAACATAGGRGPSTAACAEAAGLAALHLGDLAGADAAFARAETAAAARGDRELQARALALRARVAHRREQLGLACDRYRAAMRQLSAIGELHAAAIAERELGSILVERGRAGDALPRLAAASRALAELGASTAWGTAELRRGETLLALGQLADALAAAAAAQAAAATTRELAGAAQLLAGEVRLRLADRAAAIACFRAALAAGTATGDREVQLAAHIALARAGQRPAVPAAVTALCAHRDDHDRWTLARGQLAQCEIAARPEGGPASSDALAVATRELARDCAALAIRAAQHDRLERAFRGHAVAAQLARRAGCTDLAHAEAERARLAHAAWSAAFPPAFRPVIDGDPDLVLAGGGAPAPALPAPPLSTTATALPAIPPAIDDVPDLVLAGGRASAPALPAPPLSTTATALPAIPPAIDDVPDLVLAGGGARAPALPAPPLSTAAAALRAIPPALDDDPARAPQADLRTPVPEIRPAPQPVMSLSTTAAAPPAIPAVLDGDPAVAPWPAGETAGPAATRANVALAAVTGEAAAVSPAEAAAVSPAEAAAVSPAEAAAVSPAEAAAVSPAEAAAVSPAEAAAVSPAEAAAVSPAEAAGSAPVANTSELAVLRRLLVLSRRFHSELGVELVLDELIDAAIDLGRAERGFVLVQQPGGELAVAASRNMLAGELGPSAAGPAAGSLSRGLAEHAARTGEPIAMIDAGLAAYSVAREALGPVTSDRADSSPASPAAAPQPRAVLAVPLRRRGAAIGSLYLDRRMSDGGFDTAAAALLGELADIAALALDNARRCHELARAAEQRTGQQGGRAHEVVGDDLRLRPALAATEQAYVRAAMVRARGNQTAAARLLGLSRFGLQKKLRRLTLPSDHGRAGDPDDPAELTADDDPDLDDGLPDGPR